MAVFFKCQYAIFDYSDENLSKLLKRKSPETLSPEAFQLAYFVSCKQFSFLFSAINPFLLAVFFTLYSKGVPSV